MLSSVIYCPVAGGVALEALTCHSVFAGKEHNFVKYEDDFITDLNTPYDYESVMHYRPLSFNKNDTIPTITTTIPYFNEIIGQRFDFSAVDIIRLNRMYDCGEYYEARCEELKLSLYI